ncbi:MAG: dihydropteroate synthase [Paenibacillaceae bacterium]
MNVIRTLDCRGRKLELGRRTLIMGILNVTPDSFSDGGKYNTIQAAIDQAVLMVAEGADIIDIGGESTRPGAMKVDIEEELKRVIPIIEAVSASVSVPISIDTYKSAVARHALTAGAHILNDIWGLKEDPEMGRVAQQFNSPIILMHNRKATQYNDFIPDVIADLQESIQLAEHAGIIKEQIILDPGIGFAKTMDHNIQLMSNLDYISELGYPVVLGTSRKSFIQRTLGLPADDVLEGTAATVVLGITQGCDIMRVHDVQAISRVARMTDAITRRRLG